MKKITQFLATVMTVFALLLIPVVGVQAQVDDPIPVEEDVIVDDELAPAETKEGAVPEGAEVTGFGPADNRAAANIAVFVGGSALGAALGFGLLLWRKKSNSQIL